MCVEGESPTTNNFLNTRAKALSCNEFNEPKGSLSNPRHYAKPISLFDCTKYRQKASLRET